MDFVKEFRLAIQAAPLLSVWAWVGLFYYLNRYTRREYFTKWTLGWLFYAFWVTVGTISQDPASSLYVLGQACVGLSGVFLLWGSLLFLGVTVQLSLFGLFMLFVVVWTLFGQKQAYPDLVLQAPVFSLLAVGSLFTAVSFFNRRQKKPFVAPGMLALGFFLWGLYLGWYPFLRLQAPSNMGYYLESVLQVFVAVSMIVLVLEDARHADEQLRAEIGVVRSENEALQSRVLTTEEKCRNLYSQVRLTEGVQKAYEELRRTQQVVVQQERLRALGQMASGVAHDINNALCPITCYPDMVIANEATLSESSRRYLQNINKASKDIASIVERMREFYRRRSDSEHLMEVDINQVVGEVIDLTRPRWRDLPQRQGISISVETALESGLPPLLSDASEIREALTNLVFNSVDALPKGGTITIRTSSGCRPPSEENSVSGYYFQIEVQDNGVGMDEKVRKRCLEPFFSTKAQRGGTGLGLAMVYGVMQRHQGAIEIESAPGEGTNIRLIFPFQKGSAAAAQSADAPPVARSLRILCIDDEPIIGQILTDCLSSLNHDVTACVGGKDGVDAFRNAFRQGRPFDVVITDLGMPEMDGHQVARAIKAESLGTPVIMMTGWGNIMTDEGERAPEVDAVIPKPPKVMELNSLLLRMVASCQ